MTCCGAPAGYLRVWQHLIGGTVQSEHDTQAQANAAKAAAGGKGRVQRISRKLSS